MIVAVVQMNSGADRPANIEAADRLIRAARADGAGLVLLPEKFNLLGTHDDYAAGAEPIDGPTVVWARELARELAIDLIAGSFVERVTGGDKFANTCVHVAPDGTVAAVYRKIHMFDVEVGGQVYRESDSEAPGDRVVLTHGAAGLPVGLSICYDLRFPEVYRILALRGARLLTVPAAFTYVTGEAHWELLLRARAVENQAFVLAADQCGFHAREKRSYGNSMIVDPWGTVLARLGDEPEGYRVAELDLAGQDEIRAKLPSLANRVPTAYDWPDR